MRGDRLIPIDDPNWQSIQIFTGVRCVRNYFFFGCLGFCEGCGLFKYTSLIQPDCSDSSCSHWLGIIKTCLWVHFTVGFDDVSFGVRSVRSRRNRLFDVSDSFRQSGNFQLSRSSVSTEQLVMSTDSEGSASSPTFPTGLIRCLESAVDDSYLWQP